MNLSNIPEQGIMYALYTDKVVYRKYNREELLKDTPLTEKLLELHLFFQPWFSVYKNHTFWIL